LVELELMIVVLQVGRFPAVSRSQGGHVDSPGDRFTRGPSHGICEVISHRVEAYYRGGQTG